MLDTGIFTPERSWRGMFSEFDRLRQEMERLLGLEAGGSWQSETTSLSPALNVSEDEDNFYVRALVPGTSAEKINLSAMGDSINIQIERESFDMPEGARLHRRERPVDSVSRSIRLPNSIQQDKVQGAYKNGILSITVPKAEGAKPKKISVNAS